MFEIKVKIKHQCPYLEIAKIFDFPIYSYCSEMYDLVVIPRRINDSEMKKIEEIVWDKEGLEFMIGKDESTPTHVYFKCMCQTETAVSPRIQQHGGMVEHPITYEDGWENYKIICLNAKSQASVLKFIQTLDDHRLVSLKDLGREGIFKAQFLSTYELIENLTDRQIEVIARAYENGYYEIPRKIKTEEIAESFNVSRAASEKSLRKAENAIMKAIMPYLLFHKQIRSSSEKPFKLKLMHSK